MSRSINGACNNLINKSWGAPGAELVRLLPPHYQYGQFLDADYFYNRPFPIPYQATNLNYYRSVTPAVQSLLYSLPVRTAFKFEAYNSDLFPNSFHYLPLLIIPVRHN